MDYSFPKYNSSKLAFEDLFPFKRILKPLSAFQLETYAKYLIYCSTLEEDYSPFSPLQVYYALGRPTMEVSFLSRNNHGTLTELTSCRCTEGKSHSVWNMTLTELTLTTLRPQRGDSFSSFSLSLSPFYSQIIQGNNNVAVDQIPT